MSDNHQINVSYNSYYLLHIMGIIYGISFIWKNMLPRSHKNEENFF